MEQTGNSTNFIKRLTNEDFKNLVIMLAQEDDKINESNFYNRFFQTNKKIEIDLDIQDNTKTYNNFYVDAEIGNGVKTSLDFILDDFTINILNNNNNVPCDNIIQLFLVNKFGKEYIDFMFEERINKAIKEKQQLLNLLNNMQIYDYPNNVINYSKENRLVKKLSN